MAAAKRSHDAVDAKASKKIKVDKEFAGKNKTKHGKPENLEQDFIHFDDEADGSKSTRQKEKSRPQNYNSPKNQETFLNGTSLKFSPRKGQDVADKIFHFTAGQTSREAHAKQKALAQDRRAAKPNADLILRSKKIWERLRRKSHVPKEERDELSTELFEIITGRVKDFVFKHDSVRVIQCALKYATPAQRRQITEELKGNYRELAESKYAKFLIAKMVVGEDESRDAVVEEFYGHVKRLIRHPEASWIVDDIYRTIATKQQRAMMLREWYGPEFVVFSKSKKTPENVSADLSEILAENPEKRGPIMQHLKEMTNQLVQKKTTGFTILHDALLQYFLNLKPGSPEIGEFLSMLRDDEEGDCYKNLAFTKSGSRLVCLALAHGSSKDRRIILRFFKTHIKLLAGDQYGHTVLLAAYEVIDDTVMTSKAIFPELLGKDLDSTAQEQELLAQTEHLTARIPLLYLMSPEPPKWLLTDDSVAILEEVRAIRTETSKKEPEKRRMELLKEISPALLDLIASKAKFLAQSIFGCQFVTETLFGAVGDAKPAMSALVSLATEDAQSEETAQILSSPAVGRMLKTLVQGGRFDKETKTIKLVEPSLKFHEMLYSAIKEQSSDEGIASWANGPNSFVVVAMLEAEDFAQKDELTGILRQNIKKLDSTNKGAAIILDKLSGRKQDGSDAPKEKEKKGAKKEKKSKN